MTSNTQELNVVFRYNTVDDEIETRKAGRPMFKDVEVCDITFPGNNKTKATFLAHENEPNATRESVANGGGFVTYAMHYNQQYLSFKDGTAQPLGGTPLSEAPFLTEAKRRELAALSIRTIEQLASLDGTPLKQLGMGGRELKNQAEAYIKTAAGSADTTALAAQIEALRQQLDTERQERAQLESVIRNGGRLDPTAPAPGQVVGDIPEVEQEETEDDDADVTAARIEALDDAGLKDFIAEQTGERPKGNPSRNTLLAAAKELAMVG